MQATPENPTLQPGTWTPTFTGPPLYPNVVMSRIQTQNHRSEGQVITTVTNTKEGSLQAWGNGNV